MEGAERMVDGKAHGHYWKSESEGDDKSQPGGLVGKHPIMQDPIERRGERCVDMKKVHGEDRTGSRIDAITSPDFFRRRSHKCQEERGREKGKDWRVIGKEKNVISL